MTRRGWVLQLLLGGAAAVGYALLPVGLVRDATLVVLGLGCALVVVLAVRLHRPVRPTPWWCLAAGQLVWSLGDAVYGWYEHVLHVEPFPSPADGLYLSAYVLYAATFLLLLRGRQTRNDLDGLLDSAIFTVGCAVLSWVFVIHPTLADSGSGVVDRVIALAYPVGDLLLVGLLARLVATPGGRTGSFRLLVGAVALLLLADSAFCVLSLTSGYEGGALDLGWLGSYVLTGAAALHPSMRSLSEPVPEASARLTPRRLAALAAAGLTPPAVLAVQLLRGRPLEAWAVVVGSSLLFLLVMARMADLLRRVQQQAGELDALSRTDSLTGLANRRSADAALDRALRGAPGTGLAVAMLDLDRFKLFNDSYGHQAGDRLLVEAARGWRAQLRSTDLLARYGGEEFLLVLPGTDRGEALALLERLRAATPAGQTFSAGVAGWDGAEDAQALVHRADVALYQAKRDGRDRVVHAAALVGA